MINRLIKIILLSLYGISMLHASDNVMISNAWIRTAPPGAPMAGYFSLMNHGTETKLLVSAEAVGFGATMLHRSYDDGGLMKMEHVMAVEVAPARSVEFMPGGYHIMLMQPAETLEEGAEVPIQLGFADGTNKQVVFIVKQAEGEATPGHASHENHSSAMSHEKEHDHNGKYMVSGHHVPTLMLHSEKQSSGDWMLMLHTGNFTFSEENQDGQHVDGEGHAHLYVDGEKIARVFSDHFMLPKLPAGNYEVSVGLYTNDHKAYWVEDEAVRKTISIVVE